MAEYNYKNRWDNRETNYIDHTAYLSGAWQMPGIARHRPKKDKEPAEKANDPSKTTPTREQKVESRVSGGVAYSNNQSGRSRRARTGFAAQELLGL